MNNALDFSPLFRSTVGFDRLSRMLEASAMADNGGYPPYNIIQYDENKYEITMAVAGFSEEDLDITSKENQLIISGRTGRVEPKENAVYLHRGIAERAFERRFQLADHIKILNASMENGLLTITLEREIPEQMKPRKIEIKSAEGKSKPKTIESSSTKED